MGHQEISSTSDISISRLKRQLKTLTEVGSKMKFTVNTSIPFIITLQMTNRKNVPREILAREFPFQRNLRCGKTNNLYE